jgi:hypothetical protein
MPRFHKIFLQFFIALVPVFVGAQTRVPPPGNIKMLPGYVHQRRPGKDSQIGVIFKRNGLSITYEIGKTVGNAVERLAKENMDVVEWVKVEKTEAGRVSVAQLKDGRIAACYLDLNANFTAEARNDDDVSDFLAMVLTYNPKKK